MRYYLLDRLASPVANREVSNSPRMNQMTRAKIISFGKLKEGWDFGEGGPAPPQVVKAAIRLCILGEQLGLETDAFPGAGGDISVDFYLGDELVQILVNTDITFELTHEKGIGARYDELAYSENISVDKMVKYLMDFRAKEHVSSWTSCESYTGGNTNLELNDSIQIASRYIMKPFHSLKSSVFAAFLRGFASTFVDIIPPLRMENPSPFGSLAKTL